jgi:drug/metabolite transporter, DME family
VTRTAALLSVTVAAVLWGTSGTAQELGVPVGSPVAVAASRCLIGGGILLLVAARRPATIRALVPHARPLAVATAAMVVFQLGYLGGIRLTGVAVGTLVAIGTAPVWAGVLAALSGGRPPRRWWAATVLALVGLAALVLPGAATVDPRGIAIAAAAGAGYATFVTATARVAHRVDRVAMIGAVFAVCGAVLLVVPGGRSLGPVDATVLGGVAWLALATVALAYLLFSRGLVGVDAPTATTFTLAEPITATVLAVTLVGEDVPVVSLLGAVVLVAGLWLAGRAAVAPTRLPAPGRGAGGGAAT